MTVANEFKLYSKDGVQLNEDDLFFIRNKDVLYLDLEGKDFNYGQILDQFQVLEKIGQGGFGSVYRIKEKDTGKIFAMKTIKVEEYTNKASRIEELFREQKTLKQLDHNHIIKLHHAFQVGEDICLIMEYASGGELEMYLCNNPHSRVSEKEGRFLISQICRAVSYCHQKGIIHRDLKPENVLVTYANDNRDQDLLFKHFIDSHEPHEDIVLKVSDFGIAGMKKAGSKGEDTHAGTAKFMAPELHTGSDISASKALDIWALGIILYMMVFGFHPFKSRNRDKTIKNIIEQPVKFPPSVPVTDELKDLLCKMLEKDPENRINMFNLMNHRWFELKDKELHTVHLKAGNYCEAL